MPGILTQTQTSVPHGFPRQLYGPMVWNEDSFVANPEEFVVFLNSDDILQIEQAVRVFKALGLVRGLLAPKTFPLSQDLACRLRTLSEAIHHGRGFAALRGLESSLYTDENNVIIYAGIASYVANERAEVMIHIRDRTPAKPRNKLLPPSELALSMDFHTDVDAGDLLSLYTQSVSAEGGNQYLTSFWKVYNVLAAEHPGVLETLSQNWRWQLPNIITNTLDVQYRPIIGCIDGVVMVNFAMTFLVGSDVYPLAADAPPLIPEQRQALEILSQICREQSLKLNPIAGDILFVNNLSILHARDAYQDRPELGKTRQLLSLMLRDDRLALQKPKCFREAGDNVFSRSPEKQILLTVDEWESFAAGSQRPKLKPRHD